MRLMLVVAAVGLTAGCSPEALGQTDAFRPKIATGCQTEAGCRELQIEAERRGRGCEPNMVGRLRCSDTEADLGEIKTRLAHFHEVATEAKQRDRDAEHTKDEQARRDAHQAVLSKAAQQRADGWVQTSLRECTIAVSKIQCDNPPTEANEETVKRCVTECAKLVEAARDGVYKRALRDCVDRLVDSVGKEIADCRFAIPSRSTENLDGRRNECAAECVEQAKPLIARAKTRTSAPPATGSGGGAASGGASGGTRAKCCDGSLSPTCACPGHQGCCSHHGGVCGCGG